MLYSGLFLSGARSSPLPQKGKCHNVAEFGERRGKGPKGRAGEKEGDFGGPEGENRTSKNFFLPFVTKKLPFVTSGLDKFKFCGIIEEVFGTCSEFAIFVRICGISKINCKVFVKSLCRLCAGKARPLPTFCVGRF